MRRKMRVRILRKMIVNKFVPLNERVLRKKDQRLWEQSGLMMIANINF